LPGAPADPDVREGISMWIYDDQGRFGLPRFALEAIEVFGRAAVVMKGEAQFSFVAGNRYNRLCK
jgi:hypothetical protein